MISYWIIFIVFALASYAVGASLQRKFKRYSAVPVDSGLTGREVAEKMLRDNGIYDVTVTSTPGHLTDHYNPVSKTVNLSESVYNTNSIAAAAVAAHECGHAVQHARAYAPLQMRSALVPVVSFASNWVQWILLIGIFTINLFPTAGITSPRNHSMAVDALRSAAYTYVVAALGSLATLVYYVLMFLGGSRDE